MSRRNRNWYTGGVYHITNRGNKRQDIFKEEDDYLYFLTLLNMVKEQKDFTVLSYCLMTNHFHLEVQMKEEPLSNVMKALLNSYAVGFNKKYGVDGHLFQGRFDACTIDSTGYLLAASRYIHMNPVKAKMVSSPSEYRYSSYNAYLGKTPCPPFLDMERIMSYFGNDVTAFRKYMISDEYNEFDEQCEADVNGE